LLLQICFHIYWH